MPRALNGTGTMWYGKALPRDDGSYVVTEWITLLGVPLFPLGSKRVRPDHMTELWLKYSKNTSTNYYLSADVPLYCLIP